MLFVVETKSSWNASGSLKRWMRQGLNVIESREIFSIGILNFRREREQRVGKLQEEKEKARQEMAKEKQRDRDKRLLAIQQQQILDIEELRSKYVYIIIYT